VVSNRFEAIHMRYVVMTNVPARVVLDRAREWFAKHTRLEVAEESADSVLFSGQIGETLIRVDRHHGWTNVHAITDRVAGLDVTDVTKRFLYTLGHI
jgi:hypothetical protein